MFSFVLQKKGNLKKISLVTKTWQLGKWYLFKKADFLIYICIFFYKAFIL